MIKTLMLTAQLALSPIVGTNGLQQKQLPNPVYGEEVNLSVTYNDENFTRLAYVNENTKGEGTITSENDLYLTFNHKGISFGGFKDYQTNIGTGNNEIYIALEFDTDGSQSYESHSNEKTCVSFYTISVDEEYLYYEVFARDNGEWEASIYTYTNTLGWEADQEEITDYGPYKNKWISLTPKKGVPYCTLGHIRQYQPTIPNPSVYDNIYNFYYQNLFANEALDELGAEVGKNSLTMRQWLAHTATIVSISLLAVALAVLVIKVFKLIAGSISDIWG